MADDDLGLHDQSPHNDDVRNVIERAGMLAPHLPQQVSPQLLDCVREQLDAYARWDNIAGPHQVLLGTTAQAVQTEQLLMRSPDSLRPMVLELCVRYSEFAGWLHQDAGLLRPAMSWSDRAHDYAEELGSDQLRSYVLMRKSNIALEAGDASRSLSLAKASLTTREPLGPRSRALGLRQLALALAAIGDEAACEVAIGSAITEAGQAPREDEAHVSYCTPSYILMESGRCWLLLRRPRRATPILDAALADWPNPFLRDRGLALARLARAVLENHELERACALAVEAAELARLSVSTRSLTQLRLLSRGLAPYAQMPVVSDVQAQLRERLPRLSLNFGGGPHDRQAAIMFSS